jgi:hypothetical protein
MPLDLQDELGVPWDELADGRVHRLVRGHDFVRGGEVMEEAATNAARRLGRVVRTYKEIRWGVLYFWVQFVDHEVVIGEPCPCGSGDLLRVNQFFAECASCKATVALVMPKKERAVDDDLMEDDPLLQSLFGAAAAPVSRKAASRERTRAPREETAAPAREQRVDLNRLRGYSDVSLYWSATDRNRERMVGHALDSLGRPHLLVVDFAMLGGKRVPDPEHPGDWQHTLWSVPTGPFGDVIRLDRFRNRAPAPQTEDPSSERGARAPGTRLRLDPMTPPPERLSAFEDVTVAPFGGSGGKGRRFFGHARLNGELVLLTVRYREREGEELPDPDRPGDTLHAVRCVPVEPFGDVIDTEALFAGEADEPSEPEPAPESKPADPRTDLSRLGAFTNVELFSDGKDAQRERLYGRAVGPGEQDCLVVVDCPLVEGERVKDPRYPAGWRHTVWSVPVSPFRSLIRFEELYKQEPDLRIANPLSNLGDLSAGPSMPRAAPDAPAPPDRLSSLEDIQLFRYGGGEGKKRESFFGFGRTPDGEAVLLTVRYWQRDGQRVSDPKKPDEPLHELRVVPLAPFGAALDMDALRSGGPASPPPPEPKAERRSTDEPAAAAEGTGRRSGTKAERRSRRQEGEANEVTAGAPSPAEQEPAPDRSLIEVGELPSPPELRKLGGFSQIRLFHYGQDGGRESFYGHARAPDGRSCLLVVDYSNGAEPSSAQPAGPVQTVRWMPVEPFGKLIDLDALGSVEPVVEIQDPPDGASAPQDGSSERATFDSFTDLHLFGDPTAGERFYGYGRASGGETALLTVDFGPPDEAREPIVHWVPLAPLIPVVDLDTLFAQTPDLLLREPGAQAVQ